MSTTGTGRASEPERRARAGHAARGSGRDSERRSPFALRARIGGDLADGDDAHGDDVPEAACFSLAGLLGAVGRHPELDLETLAYHVRQSDATAAEGYWHAAINEARSFLEALLVSMLQTVRPDSPEKARGNGAGNGTPFRCYRRRLAEAGFLDADANELLQYVYSVASAKGSHHGVTSESWSRLARRMVFATGQYLIRHYEGWKSGGAGEFPVDRDVGQGVSVKSRWRERLGALCRLLRSAGTGPGRSSVGRGEPAATRSVAGGDVDS